MSVLTALVVKGLFLAIESLCALGRCLDHPRKQSGFDETLWKEEKVIFALRWVLRSAEIWCWVLICLMCLSVGMWYNLWQDNCPESVYSQWGSLCGITYLSELGCFNFKITNWFSSQFEETVALLPVQLAFPSRSRLHSMDRLTFVISRTDKLTLLQLPLSFAKIFKAISSSSFLQLIFLFIITLKTSKSVFCFWNEVVDIVLVVIWCYKTNYIKAQTRRASLPQFQCSGILESLIWVFLICSLSWCGNQVSGFLRSWLGLESSQQDSLTWLAVPLFVIWIFL